MDVSPKDLNSYTGTHTAEKKKKPSVGGKCPTASAIQTEPHCAAALSLRPSYGRGFFLVRSL